MKLGKQWKIALSAAILGNFLSFFILFGPAERLNIDILNVLFPSKTSLEDIAKEMIIFDKEEAKRDALLKEKGFKTNDYKNIEF